MPRGSLINAVALLKKVRGPIPKSSTEKTRKKAKVKCFVRGEKKERLSCAITSCVKSRTM